MRTTLIAASIAASAILLAGCASTAPQGDLAKNEAGEAGPAAPYQASGNEPFWNLQIAGNQAVVERLGEERQVFTIGRPEEDGNRQRWAGDGIAVESVAKQCIDSMSGIEKTDQVQVALGQEVLSGCGGDIVAPDTLADTQWTLISLDGSKVLLDPPPTLAVDTEGRVAGSDGCNRFMGGMAFGPEGRAASEGHGASTMMACAPEQEEVARAYNSLRGQVSGWQVDQGQLTLTTEAGKELVFKQAI